MCKVKIIYSNGNACIIDRDFNSVQEAKRWIERGYGIPHIWINEMECKDGLKNHYFIIKEGYDMIKQYIIEDAYTDNEKVTTFINGKLEYYDVMSYYEGEGYCRSLESDGYSKAYDTEKIKEELEKVKENANYLEQQLEIAKLNALIK